MAESSVCTKCGAALPAPDAVGLITCPSCGTVTKADAPASPLVPPTPSAPPAAPPLSGWPAPPVAAPPLGQWSAPAGVAGAPDTAVPPPYAGSPAPSAADGSGASGVARKAGCFVVPAVVLVIVGGSLFGALRSCQDATKDVATGFHSVTTSTSSQITLSGSATLLPADGPDAHVIVTVQDSKDSVTTRRLAKVAFTAAGSKSIWQSAPLADDADRAEIATVGDTLFAGIDDKLLALDAATGATRWTTTLHDKVTTGCPSCFAAVRGRLVVRTADAYVTAYGTTSGESLWSRRLNSTSGSISVVGDRLFVVDDPEDPSAATPVTLTDPGTGHTIRATVPTCPDSKDSYNTVEMASGDRVRAVPGSSDVFAVFGYSDGCVVRWSPATGVTQWTTRLVESGSLQQDEVQVGDRDLVVATNGNKLVTLYLPNGNPRLLAVPADVNAKPDQIVGRTLVADSTTNRGTPKGGLIAWDLGTGERLWAQSSLGSAQPVSSGPYFNSDALFDGTPRFVLVPVAGGGIDLFVFEGTDYTFSVAPLDLGDGHLGTALRRAYLTRYASGTPSLTIEGVDGPRLVVSIDTLLQAIPVSGKGPLVSYPETH